jgi:hypothetical protein
MSDGRMSPEPGTPRRHDVVFVYAWDPESRRTAETLCSGDHFDVTVRIVDGTPPDSSEVGVQRLVACVLFVSPVALSDPSFAAVVSQCSGSRLFHSDFRLFAWLTGGLTFDELRDKANQGPPGNPCSQLLESSALAAPCNRRDSERRWRPSGPISVRTHRSPVWGGGRVDQAQHGRSRSWGYRAIDPEWGPGCSGCMVVRSYAGRRPDHGLGSCLAWDKSRFT